MNKKFFHSVYLDESLCKGCINCIKRCPTQVRKVENKYEPDVAENYADGSMKAAITQRKYISILWIYSTTTHTRLLFLHLLCMRNSITWMMSIFC